jgi:uncharacterized membrane protein YciS (DUF1049 family)
MSPTEALGIALILIALAVPVIIVGVVYYLKKRFEHKQIMTAIEKGTPLSELKPPKQNGALWIRNLTFGIALLIIGLPLILVGTRIIGGVGLFIAFVFFGVGVAWLIRGLLYRKYQLQSQSSDKSDTAENKNAPGASTSETLQPTNE